MRRAVWAVLTGLTAAACATTPKDRMDDLRKSVETYNEAFRWRNYQRAALFLPSRVRSAYVATYDDEEEALHVEGYQILAVDMSGPEIAKVTVRYRYMQLPSVVLEKKKVTQHWAEVNGQWTLEHEDNPIRAMDLSLTQSVDSFGGPEPDPSAEVEVLDADGNLVKKRKGRVDAEGPGRP